jgi:hypothetical protein
MGIEAEFDMAAYLLVGGCGNDLFDQVDPMGVIARSFSASALMTSANSTGAPPTAAK